MSLNCDYGAGEMPRQPTEEIKPEQLESTTLSKQPTTTTDWLMYSHNDHVGRGLSVRQILMKTLKDATVSDESGANLADPTYCEEDHDDDDDASIHHGGNDIDSISVPNEQDDRPLNRVSLSATGLRGQHNTAQREHVLPAHLDDQLEKWYAKHGRRLPKCAQKRQTMDNLWRHNGSEADVTWWHKSGVPLDVKWYFIPRKYVDSDDDKRPTLVVVHGEGVVPSIVTFHRSNSLIAGIQERGVAYKVWRGVDGNRDGLEDSPSVIKVHKATVTLTAENTTEQPKRKSGSYSLRSNTNGSSKICNSCIRHHQSCDGKRPICKRCASAGKDCVYYEKDLSRKELEKILKKKPGGGSTFQSSDSTCRPLTRNSSKGVLPTRKRGADVLDEEDDDAQADTVLAKSMTSLLLKTLASHPLSGLARSARWPCCLCDTVSGDREQLLHHMTTQHGIDSPDKAPTPTKRQRLFEKAVPVDKVPNAGKMQPTASMRNVARERAANRVQGKPEKEQLPRDLPLGEHIMDNATVKFYSDAQPPRTRLFAACNSVHKIFAQAITGGVFTRGGAKVLALELGEGTAESPVVEVAIMEDDEEDFDQFVKQLRSLPCWSFEHGHLVGHTTVRVQEKH